MKTKVIVLILILSLAMNVAVLSVVGYNFYYHSHQSFPIQRFSTQRFSTQMNHHFYQILGLTPMQQIRMEPIAALFHQKLEAHYTTIKIKKNLLVNLLSQKNIDQSQIDQLRKHIAAIQDNIQRMVISHILDVKLILTENQQERFFVLMHKSMNTEHCFSLNNGDH
ncbi:Spy/CpxP family protein refolding chaperone [Desulfobacula sp.]